LAILAAAHILTANCD